LGEAPKTRDVVADGRIRRPLRRRARRIAPTIMKRLRDEEAAAASCICVRGSFVAVGDDSGDVVLFINGKAATVARAHRGGVLCCALSSSGDDGVTHLVSGGADGTVRISAVGRGAKGETGFGLMCGPLVLRPGHFCVLSRSSGCPRPSVVSIITLTVATLADMHYRERETLSSLATGTA